MTLDGTKSGNGVEPMADETPIDRGRRYDRDSPALIPGHPVNTFRRENVVFDRIVHEMRAIFDYIGFPPDEGRFDEKADAFKDALARLAEIEKHYLRKEKFLFPILEKYGVPALVKTMWAAQIEVRMLLKSVRVALDAGDLNAAISDASALIDNVTDLLYKEEDAFFPLCLETLTERDWIVCRLRGDEVGYAFVTPGDRWPEGKITLDETDVIRPGNKSGEIPLHTGSLDLEQLSLLLNNLPFDITFADENDIVRYYNNPKERVFERSPDIIGRTVQDCHQDASVPQVNKIINAFKAGERHDAELWITHHGKFVHIRYFAIRDIGGDYRGVMEIAQDVTAIRALEGERRKLDW